MRIDPQTTQLYMAHKKQERMSGLGDIPITAKRIDEGAIQDQYNEERKFAASQRNSDRSYNLQLAQERRLSQPSPEDDEFAKYAAMSPERRDLYDRMKGRKAGEATGGGGLGLNERQTGGMKMQRDAALDYAANLTGMSREEIENVYATQGAAGVEKLMLEKGERSVQGKTARWLQSIPLGKTFVEAENADLLPQGKSGGAGIALMQNPSGPITQADFTAGEAQFPNPSYPLPNQASMVRSILGASEKAEGKPTASADPLAAHVGKVIMQGGKRYQVMKVASGKHVAVELK
jgi:hypothetical protein